MPSKKIYFTNSDSHKLSARLEFPLTQKPNAYAIFAHVFTGSKSLSATRYISQALTLNGIAVLRFDFTGLGESEGDFADTNFSSNVEDIIAAADYLKENYEAPKIIVGHSLGGAASIFAASRIDSIRAVATIGTPSEPEHVTHLIASGIEEIEQLGKAKVRIGGREFMIKKQFLEDLRSKNMFEVLRELKKPILVMHSPQDRIVSIDNAAKIYHAAYHPKSFVTLDGADHMLTNKNDSCYAGTLISSWVRRYIEIPQTDPLTTERHAVAKLGAEGYTTDINAGGHGLVADEPEEVGGNNFGPTPYGLLNAALGACTAMTLQMYARRKKWDLQEVKVHLSFSRNYHKDCEHCDDKKRKIEVFEREIEIRGNLDEKQRNRLLEIANKCPVHKTLEGNAEVYTKLLD